MTSDSGADRKQIRKELRADKEFAREVFEFLLPDEQIRRQCLEFLANSVQMANRLTPERWGITLRHDSILMNCGMIEILTIVPDGIHVITDVESLPVLPTDQVEVCSNKDWSPKGFYRSVPGSVACDFDAEKAFLVLPQISDSHHKLIQKAARTPFAPNRKNAHSPGVIRFLSEYLKQALPQPAYFIPARSDSDDRDPSALSLPMLPEEVEASGTFPEGSVKKILVNAYERDEKARATCILLYGTRCIVCELSFEETYGEVGRDFIHVHHLTPLSKAGEVSTDPSRDLRPVCANCHAIIHRRNPPYTPEEVKAMIQAMRQSITQRGQE